MSDLHKLLSRAHDLLDFAEGSIAHDRAYCFKCHGAGEILSDAFDEPPEACELCGAREELLGDIKIFKPDLEAEIHKQFKPTLSE